MKGGLPLMIDNITKDQLSELIKDKRNEFNFTAKEVIQKLKSYGVEISDKTLWGYENGVSSPSVPTFLALCKIYEMEDLFFQIQNKSARTVLSDREKTMLNYFRLASIELQDAAMRMLEPAEKEDTVSKVG
ncbi:MAG: helix-turn-helix transcriptional regulator, partial [Treponema sp.]|nr:helix-turn-helix transcriptional regulator [Candidatus Treponema caballi]